MAWNKKYIWRQRLGGGHLMDQWVNQYMPTPRIWASNCSGNQLMEFEVHPQKLAGWSSRIAHVSHVWWVTSLGEWARVRRATRLHQLLLTSSYFTIHPLLRRFSLSSQCQTSLHFSQTSLLTSLCTCFAFLLSCLPYFLHFSTSRHAFNKNRQHGASTSEFPLIVLNLDL